jgi:hypothetical protein
MWPTKEIRQELAHIIFAFANETVKIWFRAPRAWALTTAATPRATGSALIVVSVTLIIPRHIFLRFGCLLLRFACSKQALFR